MGSVGWDEILIEGLRSQGPVPRQAQKSDYAFEKIRFGIIKNNVEYAIQIFNEGEVDLEMVCDRGWTLLMYASSSATLPLVRIFLTAGASVQRTDPDGHNCLTILGSHSDDGAEILKTGELLIEAGANVNAKTNYFWTPIMFAVKNQRVELARLLLAAGADPNVFDEDERTALLIAAEMGSGPLISVLLEYGADQTFLNEDGLSAFDLTLSYGYRELSILMFNLHKSEYVPRTKSDLLVQMSLIMPPPPPDKDKDKPEPKSESKRDRRLVCIIKGEDGVERTPLELFLLHLKLERHSAMLSESGVSFAQFMCSTNEELIEMGIRLLGHRMKILDGIRAVQNMEWSGSSLIKIQNKTSVTTSDTTSALLNFKEHMEVMGSTLKFLKHNREMDQKEEDGGQGSTSNDDQLTAFIDKLDLADTTLSRLSLRLHALVEFLYSIQGRVEFRHGDEIVFTKMDEWKSKAKANVGGLIFLGVCAVGMRLGFFPEILLNSYIPRLVTVVTKFTPLIPKKI